MQAAKQARYFQTYVPESTTQAIHSTGLEGRSFAMTWNFPMYTQWVS